MADLPKTRLTCPLLNFSTRTMEDSIYNDPRQTSALLQENSGLAMPKMPSALDVVDEAKTHVTDLFKDWLRLRYIL